MLQKNENVTEDMVAILTCIQRRVPDSGQPLFLVERARNSSLAATGSTTATDQLDNVAWN